MLLEIALNAGSVVLEGAGGVRLPAAAPRRPCGARLAFADRIVSYRIAIFCLISYRIYRFLLWLYRAITM